MSKRSSKAGKILTAAFKSPLCEKRTEIKANTEDLTSVMRKISELENKNQQLEKELGDLINMGLDEEELTLHIDRLHTYNEIKDVAQMLLGKIAMEEGCTTKQLYEEFGLGLDD